MVASPDLVLLLRGFAPAIVAEAVYAYVLVYTRVRTTLTRYAKLEAGTAALHLLLGVLLAWAFGLPGAFAGLAIASAAGVAVASRWVELRPVFRSPALRGMLQVGWPIALTGAVGTLLNTADRWIVAAWGGQELLGYYAFAGALASAAAAFALAIRTVVFPEVYGDARRSGAAPALRRHLERSLMPFATLLPPLLGALGFFLGPAVALAAPAYAQAVAPARLFLLAGAAVGTVNLAAIGAVAAGQQRQLPVYAGAALGLNLALSAVALAVGAGLEGVAVASLAGHLLFAWAVVRLNARLSGILWPDRLTLRALRPLAWCAAAVVIAGRVGAELDSDAAGLGAYLFFIRRWGFGCAVNGAGSGASGDAAVLRSRRGAVHLEPDGRRGGGGARRVGERAIAVRGDDLAAPSPVPRRADPEDLPVLRRAGTGRRGAGPPAPVLQAAAAPTPGGRDPAAGAVRNPPPFQ